MFIVSPKAPITRMPVRNEPAGAHAERRDDHDHDQQDRTDHVVLQVAQDLPDILRTVLAVGDLDDVRPFGAGGLDRRANAPDRVDDVLARPFRDLERQGRLPVHPGEAVRVLEGAADGADIADGDDRVALHLQRDRHHVANRLEDAGDLDRETPLAGIHGAGRNQLVEPRDHRGDLFRVQLVALQQDRVDDHLDQLVAVAGDVGFQHRRDRLDLVLEAARQAQQRALGYRPRQGDDKHREKAEIDLGDARLVGVVG
jgi:hypothetical protein